MTLFDDIRDTGLAADVRRAARPCPAVPGAKPAADFNGPAYSPERDRDRLNGQIRRVYDLMADGRWRTLSQIAVATGDPHASISAQLRHLRKPRFGGHTVERRHVGNGLYEYRLVPNPTAGSD